MYLALGGGPPRFPQASSWLVVLGYQQQQRTRARYGVLTLYDAPFQAASIILSLYRLVSSHVTTPFLTRRQYKQRLAPPLYTPWRKTKRLRFLVAKKGNSVDPTTPTCKHIGLGSSPVARRYWGNHVCFLFLRVLRCFSSPRTPCFRSDRSLHLPGCPIRTPVDHSLLAAPYGISSLGTSFVGTPPQGIHQRPCVALNTTFPQHNAQRSNAHSHIKHIDTQTHTKESQPKLLHSRICLHTHHYSIVKEQGRCFAIYAAKRPFINLGKPRSILSGLHLIIAIQRLREGITLFRTSFKRLLQLCIFQRLDSIHHPRRSVKALYEDFRIIPSGG